MKRFFFLLLSLGLLSFGPFSFGLTTSAMAADDDACNHVRRAITAMIDSPVYSIYPVVSGKRARTPSLEVSEEGVFVTEGKERKKIGERETFRLQMTKIMEEETLTGCQVVAEERIDKIRTVVYGYLSREGPERVWISKEDGRIYRIRTGQGAGTQTTALVYGK